MAEVTEDFAKCWQAAGIHLDKKFDGGIHSWIKSNLTPPFLEHLSFRLGNQLFFIRIEDVDEQLETPGSIEGLNTIAKLCKGHEVFSFIDRCLICRHRLCPMVAP